MFGTVLSALMKQRGVSQRRVAEAAGVTQQSVSDWVNGRTLPRKRDTVPRLEQLLGDDQRTLRRALGGLLDDDTPPPRPQIDGFSTRYHDLPPEARAEVDAFLEFQEQKHRKGKSR